MNITFCDEKDKVLAHFNITKTSCCCAGEARSKLEAILNALEDKENTYVFFDSEFWEKGFIDTGLDGECVDGNIERILGAVTQESVEFFRSELS